MNEMAGHVARLGGGRRAYRVLVGRLRKRGHLEDLGIDGRKVLNGIFKKVMGECMDWIDLTQGMDT